MGFPIDPFSNFISNAPLADTPGSSDMLALIQNNITKRLPVSGIPGLTPIVVAPTKVITAGASYAALSTDYYIVVDKTVGSATAINLPGAPGTGATYIIKDGKGDAGTNNITINGNGKNIDGAATFILAFNFQSVELIYSGTSWGIN